MKFIKFLLIYILITETKTDDIDANCSAKNLYYSSNISICVDCTYGFKDKENFTCFNNSCPDYKPKHDFYDSKISDPLECKTNCSINDINKYEDENICYNKCPTERQYYNESLICIENCQSPFSKHDEGENECKENCTDGKYEFNNVCYKNCPSLTKEFNDSGTYICQCKYNYYKINYTDEITICLENSEPCPYDFPYLFNSNSECFAKKPNDTECPYIRKTKTIPENYECVSECDKSEYYYTDNENNTYCVTQCPLNKFSFVYNKTCVSSCDGLFVDESNKICYDSWDGLYLVDGIENIKKCILETKCPSNYPFYYKNKKACLTNCSLLKENSSYFDLDKNENYSLYKENNECFTSCPENTFAYEEEKLCVNDCKDYNKYSYNGVCYNNCTDANSSLSNTENYLIELDNTHKCIFDNSTEYYYIYEGKDIKPKKYFKNGCPEKTENNEYLYQDDLNKTCYTHPLNCTYQASESLKKCIKCEIPTPSELSNEGYYISDSAQNNFCYKKCPNDYPYYIGNICYNNTDNEIFNNTKNIDGTNEYVKECPISYFEFNNICYHGNCPFNTKNNENSTICNCSYKYYFNEKNEIKCLGIKDLCPTNYNYIQNNQCQKKCDDEYTYIRLISSNPNNYECLLEKCDNNEYYYNTTDNITLCTEKCPDDFPYHDYEGENEKLCREKCDETTHFTDESNKLCYKICPNSGLNLLNPEINESIIIYGNCIKGSTCPKNAEYYFEYNKTCLNNCSLTEQYSFFGNIKTYLNTENNECVENCPNKIDNQTNHNCVKKCAENQFEYNNVCYENCSIAQNDLFYVYETHECVENCSNYYLGFSETICYKNCPSDYYYDDENKTCYANGCPNDKFLEYGSDKKCVSCGNINNETDNSTNKGYYILDENVCYKECPKKAPYYNHGNNECKKECNDDFYIQKENSYECFDKNSCGEIGGLVFNDICYKSCPDNTKNDTENHTCECSDKYYKYDDGSGKQKIKCLETGQSCPINLPFYDPEIKLCSDSCQDYRRIISSSITNYECIKNCSENEFKYTKKENENSITYCTLKCPEKYPYHIDGNNNTCLEKCDPEYYIDEQNYICYEKCPKYNIKENSKCIEKCPSSYPFLYNDETCVSDCEKLNLNMPVYLDINNNTCIKKCENFYDFTTKKCVKECGEKQFKNETGNVCYDSCPEVPNAKIIHETQECLISPECPLDYPFTYNDNVTNDNKTECYKSCPYDSYQYDNKTCFSKCPDDKPYIDEEKKYCLECNIEEGFKIAENDKNKICYKKCPNNAPYFRTGDNKCYEKGCPVNNNDDDKKFNILLDGTYQCIEKCDNNSFIFNNVCYNDSCPIGTNNNSTSENNNTCYCSYKYYSQKINNDQEIKNCLKAGEACPSKYNYVLPDGECVNTECDKKYYRRKIPSSSSYECVDACNKDEFIYENNEIKYCVNKCNDDKKFHVSNETECKENCSITENENYYTDELNNICYEDCPELYLNLIKDGKKDKCVLKTECLSKNYYIFNDKYCLSSCNDTINVIINDAKKTVLDKENSKCVSECDNETQYIDNNTENCVKKCASYQYLYLNDKRCYDSCPTGDNEPKYIIEDLKQCVKSCKENDYYSLDNNDTKCYKTCPNGYIVDEENKKCYDGICPENYFIKVSLNKCIEKCNVPKDKNNITINEGYIKTNETNSTKLCLEKCPDDKPYINKEENICYEKGNINLNKYQIYSSNEFVKKCESTFNLEFNNICYSEKCPQNTKKNENKCECLDKFYNDTDNNTVCLYLNQPCPETMPYFYEKKCDFQCPNEINITKKMDTNPINYQCLKECPEGEYEYKNTCLKKCNEGKYHIFKEYKCLDNCTKESTEKNINYFTDEINYICYEKCPGLSTIIRDENGFRNNTCISDSVCPSNYYYYDVENVCLQSCNDTKEIFGKNTKIDEDNKKCLNKCPNEKYVIYKNDTCVDKCEYEYKFIYKNYCYDNCTNATNLTYYLFETNECLTENEVKNYYNYTDSDIYYKKCPSDSFQDDEKKECKNISDCITNNKYIKKSNNKCVTCEIPKNIDLLNENEGFINGTECLEECPSGFEYYNYGNNTCYAENDTNLKSYKIESMNVYTDKCPENYYLFNKFCYKNSCPINTYLVDEENNICNCSYNFIYNNITEKYTCYSSSSSCPDDYKFFDDEYGCLEKCTEKKPYIKKINSGSRKYECVKECLFDEYIYSINESEKYYVDECPEDKKYHIFNQKDCLSSCNSSDYYTNDNGFVCEESCPYPYLKTLNDVNITYKGNCVSGNECPSGLILFDDEKLCLPNCSITLNLTEPVKTYLHESTTIKQCTKKCDSMLTKKITDEVNNVCIEKCTSDQFIYKNSCYKNCSDINDQSLDYYIYENKECVVNCSSYYSIENSNDKICYKNCPSNYYINETSNTCIENCLISEGFIIKNDIKKICYSKCPNNLKNYNNDTNECIEKCIYPYQYENMDTGECSISNNCPNDSFIFNYQCYRNCPNNTIEDNNTCICQYKYYKSLDDNKNEIIICLNENDTCPENKNYTTYKNECVTECPEDTYQDDDSKMCYNSSENISCKNGYYLKISTKKCIKECNKPSSNETIINQGFYISDLKNDEKKICYDECPSNYTYDIDENICHLGGCSNEKYPNIILGTNKCTNDCPTGYYLFNNICYKDECPENTKYDNELGKCKCKYKFVKLTNTTYKCLSQNSACPYKKHIFDNELGCINNCSDYRIQYSISLNGTIDYFCNSTCENYIYENDENEKYCFDECPKDKKYHYYNETYCVSSCDYLTDEENLICYNDTCPNYNIINENDINTTTANCIENCPSNKIYSLENKTCLSNCKITEKFSFLGNKTTYKVIESNKYNCVTNCSLNEIKKLTDTVQKECVEKCGENLGGGKYLYNGKCYNNCSLANENLILYLDDTKECVSECPQYYYKENSTKRCYKNCPDKNNENKELYTKNQKYCVTCEIPNNFSNINENEGFYIPTDSSKKCYEKCPDDFPYYDFGDNKCFSDSCLSDNNFNRSMKYSLYSNITENYVCFLNCSDAIDNWQNYITEDLKCISGNSCPKEYPYEFVKNEQEKICYKSGCPNSFLKKEKDDNNITHCITECNKTDGNFYSQGDSCVTECNNETYPYRIEPSSINQTIGMCLKQPSECLNLNFYYYNNTDKICSEICNDKKIQTNPLTGKPFISSEGTCVKECPEDYHYEYNNICYNTSCPEIAPFINETNPYKCLDSCGENYEFQGKFCIKDCNSTKETKFWIKYDNDNKKKCVNSCKENNKYYFADDNQCIDECKIINDNKTDYYYFNPDTNQCAYNCNKTFKTYKYYQETIDESLPCLIKCPEGSYYYEEEKKCLEKCNDTDYHSSSNNYLCVKKCEKNEKIIFDTNQCTEKCDNTNKYLISLYYDENNTVEYCHSKCDGSIKEEYKYISSLTNQCVKKCEDREKFLYENTCYTKCPIGYQYYICNETDNVCECKKNCNSEEKKFNNENSYKCLNNCTGKYKYKIDGNDLYTCFTECPSGYNLQYQNDTEDFIICTDKCNNETYEFENKCIKTCEPYKLENTTRKCYEECPSKYPYSSIAFDNKTEICVEQCDEDSFYKYYSSSNKECFSECPYNYNFIGKNRKCKKQCEISDGIYYYKSQNSSNNEYVIYTCVESCKSNGFLEIFGTKECSENCTNNSSYKSEKEGVCYNDCKNSKNYQYSLEENGNFTCVEKCPTYKQYFDDDKKCIDSCSQLSLKNITNQNGECVEKCDNNSLYKFEENSTCVEKCSSEKYYKLNQKYICTSICKSPKNYISTEGECSESCDYFKYNLTNDEIKCLDKCPVNYTKYYNDSKICLSSCDKDDYEIEYLDLCVKTCNKTDTPYFYIADENSLTKVNTCFSKCPNDKQFVLNNNTCSDKCENNYLYYKPSNKICLSECPNGFKSHQTEFGYECIINCPLETFLYNTSCVSSCPNNYSYYFEYDKECLENCGRNYFSIGEICVDKCNNTYPYALDTVCQEKCNDTNKYLVKVNNTNYCKDNCPSNLPYITANDSDPNAENITCYSECPETDQQYYIKGNNITKICKSKCEGDYKFIGDDGKECIKNCSSSKPYYEEKDDNINCFNECPDDYYHDEGGEYSYMCRKYCNNENYPITYYDKKLCIKECNSSKILFYKKEEDIIYCLDTCNVTMGLYITPQGSCVDNCNDVNDEPYLIADIQTHQCICQNLYYIDDGKKKCFKPNITDCSQNKDYNIQYENTLQCLTLKNCSTVISIDNICLKKSECPENKTQIKKYNNGVNVCKCAYKFYKNEKNYNKTTCLNENENCPNDYNLLVNETKECVKSCPDDYYDYYPYKYKNFCLKECPENTEKNEDKFTCECKNYWIKKENEEIECLDKCNTDYPLLVNETKECVQKCPIDYDIIYNLKCLDECEENTKEISIDDETNSLKKYSDYTCKCNNLWYYISTNEINCTDITFKENENKCSELNNKYKFLIFSEKQCVESCPTGYYKFNYDCYTSCDVPENTNFTGLLKIKSSTSNECICREFSVIDNNNLTSCLVKELCPDGYLNIEELNQCYFGNSCPTKYPRQFNYKCYSSCPENTYYDSSKNSTFCLCENLWFTKTNSNNQQVINCLEKSKTECSPYKKYLIYSTKECVDTVPEDYYLYNFVIYENCPKGTSPNNNTKIKTCICDSSYGSWYNDTYNDLLKCELKNCPNTKPYLLNDTKECVSSCKDYDNYFTFEKTCYKGGCPEKYIQNDQDNTCNLKSLESSNNITEFISLLKENLDYYINKSKLEYNSSRFGADIEVIQLYENATKNKDINFNNDLTYIDFSNCLEQIKQKNADKLKGRNPIVIKADITGNVKSNNYGSVEYEIYTPDGEKLEASCDNSITISFPIQRLFNKYNSKRVLEETINEGEKLNYLYNFGKKVYNKYNDIDTLHSENDFYYDICVSCEIDGKDLILKERPNYYPNNISLCQNQKSECKHSKTNFEQDRIECLCKINSNGITLSENDSGSSSNQYIIISQSEANSNQKGPTNFPVLKCIDDFAVKKNGLFVYSIIILILEFILGIFAFTLGIKFLIERLNNKIIQNNKNKNNQNNDYNDYANPPRKNVESSEDDEEQKNYNKFNIKVNMPELKITNIDNEEYAFGKGIELIPREYSHFFFAIKDSGVTKEINRNQLPFKISENTKYLLEPIPGATYGDKFNNPTSFKQNILIVKDDEKKIDINDINIKVNMKIDKKVNKENNEIKKVKSKKVFKKIPTALYGDDSKEKSIEDSSENKDSEEEIKNKKIKKYEVNVDDSDINEQKKNKLYGKKKVENEDNEDISNVRINKKNESNFNDYNENRNNNESRNNKNNMNQGSFSFSDEYNPKSNIYEEESLCFLIKREKRYKEYEYEKAAFKDKENICIFFLTFICDKIYLFDIILFRKDYDIFSPLITLYLFYHLLIISLITAFFDIPTLSKIYNQTDYPNFGHYLLFGLYTMLLSWVVYRLLMCLIRNNNDSTDKNYGDKIVNQRDVDDIVSKTKIKLLIFYLIIIGFSLLFFFYLSLFGSIYTGTKKKIFIAYLIALLEILVVKIVYAILLGTLRKVALCCQSVCLYSVVKFMDLYLS